jgi:hypothetical protein
MSALRSVLAMCAADGANEGCGEEVTQSIQGSLISGRPDSGAQVFFAHIHHLPLIFVCLHSP